MILSMTGYGEAQKEFDNKIYKIEIKSLNGKTTDVRFKSNLNLREKEIELRRIIRDKAYRGKFEVNLNIGFIGEAENDSLNIPLMKSYSRKLQAFADDQGIPYGDLIQSNIRLPDIVQTDDEGLSEDEWTTVKEMTERAIENLNNFRMHEGDSLEKDILPRVENIASLLNSFAEFEEARIITLKDRINKNLELYLTKDNIDENRFEQEVIYYLEKLDINEEKVRLSQHCQHFIDAVKNNEAEKGRKLGFISQEIGREINTLGSKAQQSDIQQIVVNMKDELEKIKEQVMNIL